MAAGPLLVDHDYALAKKVKLEFNPGGQPRFQFPPVCISETKVADWMDMQAAGASERPAVNMGSQARKLTIEITYILDDEWDGLTIAEQIRTMKANYYLQANAMARFIKVTFYEISPAGGTYRMNSISVNYDGPLITQGDTTYPMVSKVTLDIQLYTQMGANQDKKQDVKDLVPAPERPWY